MMSRARRYARNRTRRRTHPGGPKTGDRNKIQLASTADKDCGMSKPRTIEEVKNDIRGRVGQRAPFLHADKIEAEEALAKMPNFDGETWAAAWNDLGARWEQKANTAEKSGDKMPAKE